MFEPDRLEFAGRKAERLEDGGGNLCRFDALVDADTVHAGTQDNDRHVPVLPSVAAVFGDLFDFYGARVDRADSRDADQVRDAIVTRSDTDEFRGVLAGQNAGQTGMQHRPAVFDERAVGVGPADLEGPVVPEERSREIGSGLRSVDSHSNMASSLIEKDTSAVVEDGCAVAQAALSAPVTSPSSMRRNWVRSTGDWPCLSETMTSVSRGLMAETIRVSWVSMKSSALATTGLATVPAFV